MKRPFFAAIASLTVAAGLSGAVEAQTETPAGRELQTGTVEFASGVYSDLKAANATVAIAVLDSVCVPSLPSFAKIRKLAAKNGFTAAPTVGSQGLPFEADSTTYAMTLSAEANDDGSKTCSVCYNSNESVSSYRKRLSQVINIAEFEKTGEWPKYRNTNAIFSATTSSRRNAGVLVLCVNLDVK